MFSSRLNLVDIAPTVSMAKARLKHLENTTEINKECVQMFCREHAKACEVLEATPTWDSAFNRLFSDEAKERAAATNAFIVYTGQNEVGLSLVIEKYIRGNEVIEILDAYEMGYTFFGGFLNEQMQLTSYRIAVDLKNRSTRTQHYDEMFKMLKSLSTPVMTSLAYSGLFPQFTQYSL